MTPFKIGDIVALKSGGPLMTVSAPATASGPILCSWFSGQVLMSSLFTAETLIAKAAPVATEPAPK